MSKQKKITFEKLLSSLNTFWGKVAVIGVILFAGFQFGGYHKESILLREYHKMEIIQEKSWRTQEEIYKNQIDELKRERIELLSTNKELEYIIKHGDEKKTR